jgi:hypothetical protein
MVLALFPDHKPKVIARTFNKSDAEAQVRFLQRSVPEGNFYVSLDPDLELAQKPKATAGAVD